MSPHRCPRSNDTVNLEPGERCWRCNHVQERTLDEMLRAHHRSSSAPIVVLAVLVGAILLGGIAYSYGIKDGRALESCVRAGGETVDQHGQCIRTMTSTVVVPRPTP